MMNVKTLTSTLAASIVVTVMGAFDVANAATFNFSFSNEDGAVPGTVEGEIELPDGDGTFAATAVTITSAPAALGYTIPIDVLAGFDLLPDNTFTVVNGAIDATASSFFAVFTGGNTAFALNGTGFGAGGRSFLDVSTGGFLGVPGTLDLDSSTLTYSSPSVPEPTSMIALAGLGFFGVASKLKKKA